jgi:lysophospholipase L1-like esterase
MIEIKSPVRILALGDSYTIGEAVSPTERWPVLLASSLRAEGLEVEDPRIVATTGWRTDQLKQAVEEARLPMTHFNLVFLLIGVNNQYQGKNAQSYEAEFRELLERAIALASGKARVMVLSIPDYGFTPFGEDKRETISREIDQYNAVNRRIASDEGVVYLDITGLTRRGLQHPELVAADGLHPSGAMYGEWVALIMSRLHWPAR